MRSGMVSVIGRPNVGKSTLVNALVGQKVSIVSHKPQTTRHRIQGVLHEERGQVVFVDTPGLHKVETRELNKVMNQAAAGAIHDVDVVLLVVELTRWTEEDEAVLRRLDGLTTPVGLVVNKIDRLDDKEKLLPLLQRLSARRDFAFIIPLSAQKRSNLQGLIDELFSRLPEGDPLYPEDMVTGNDLGFTVSEVIREKLIRTLHQELPYSTTVQVEDYKREGNLDRIHAVIWVEREGQKKIVIGEGGAALKAIGTAARRDLERMLGRKVFLQIWCKIRENWSDDPKALKRFGLTPD